jgi:hypothetical protein
MKTGIYEESGWVAEVRILEDNCNEEWERYKLEVTNTLQESPIFGAQEVGHIFEVSAQRKYRTYVDWNLEFKPQAIVPTE